MDRRTFFSLSGASAVALTTGGAPTASGTTAANSAAPPLKARLGHQIHQATDSNLAYLARYGVEGISAAAAIKDPARIFATADEMMQDVTNLKR